MARKPYVKPEYSREGLLLCLCGTAIEKLVIEPDLSHYDTWDVVCSNCGARTSQFAVREMALQAWNAMSQAVVKSPYRRCE